MFTDKQILNWIKQHNIKLSFDDARCAFEDAASQIPLEKPKYEQVTVSDVMYDPWPG